MAFWTYILHCNAGVFYTGHTDDLERRIGQHKAGTFEGFTKRYLPVELAWVQEFGTREEAQEAEKRIKGWSRKKKLALIRGDWDSVSLYAKSKGNPSTSSGCAEVMVSENILNKLRAEAAADHPNECCGVLLGEGKTITELTPAKNIHSTPETHFEIDPAALVAAHREQRNGGPKIIGYYHSHPKGPPEPSRTDQASAAGDGRIWAIIGRSNTGEREVRIWRDDPDGFKPLSYEMIED